MKSIVTYVRSLIGWSDDPVTTPSFKRDRTEDDNHSDVDQPAFKRLKQPKQAIFPNMESNEAVWNKSEKSPKVRYVPIHVESGYPSTSTPNDVSEKYSRIKTIPLKLIGVSENGASTPVRKQRMHTPVKPVIHTMIDDDDDDDKVTWIETKKDDTKKPTKIYIAEDDEDSDGEDVVFVKKIESQKPVKPYKFFATKFNCPELREDPVRWNSLSRRLQECNQNISPKSYSKFVEPPGITKSYKKVSVPVSKWMQTSKPMNLQYHRIRPVNLYGNARSTLSEVFNLNEKKNYQELIKRVAGSTINISTNKPLELIDLAKESAMYRNTLRAQKRSMNEIKLVEKGLSADKESETTTEYDPITVASINSSDSEIEVVPSESSTSSSIRIEPMNSLKECLKDNPVTCKDWLANLDTKYRKKNTNTKEKLLDAQRECDIISKVSYEQRLAHLQHKFKYELSIPESLIEEPKPTVELPTLTPEQEKLVNRALGPGPPNQLLVEKFNLRIHRRDLQTLAGLNWLNDEVINFYMNLLMQRSEERKDLLKVYATNTFFYPKLMQSGQSGLKRWTRKVDIFAHDLMVIPVHLGVHWCLSLVQFRERRVAYLDSMGGRNQPALDALLQYLRDEHRDKKGQPFDDTDWKTECLKDIPQQMNGSDCGMFACTFAEFASRGCPFSFSQQHMPALRRKAALEILQGRLLL